MRFLMGPHTNGIKGSLNHHTASKGVKGYCFQDHFNQSHFANLHATILKRKEKASNCVKLFTCIKGG